MLGIFLEKKYSSTNPLRFHKKRKEFALSMDSKAVSAAQGFLYRQYSVPFTQSPSI